jgi:selenocysteine lyase/cysteine desulfurase
MDTALPISASPGDVDALLAREFPLEESVLYLNHAGVAPLPRRAGTALARFADQAVRRGAADYPQWLEVEARLRGRLRALINAPSDDDIALLKNTSEGLSVVAHGFPWRRGDNVVIADEEFPSNRIVWESLAPYGVEVRYAPVAGTTPETEFEARVDARTRMIAVSSVQYASGRRMPLPAIAGLCRRRGIALCVDAIQSLGALPFDAQALGADFVVADLHKWMLGPEGVCLFYTAPQAREWLTLHQYGWHMTADPHDFDRPDWSPSPSARRFECGSPNMAGVHAAAASLSLLLEIGIERVAERVLARSRWLLERIAADRRLECLTPPEPGRHAGIVTFRRHDEAPPQSFARLRAAGVVCALRGGGVRFSPHCHTPFAVLERALALVLA